MLALFPLFESPRTESEEDLNSLLVKVKEEIDEETVETVTDFIFLGSKITADRDCSHEIKTLNSLEEKL